MEDESSNASERTIEGADQTSRSRYNINVISEIREVEASIIAEPHNGRYLIVIVLSRSS